jgi:hypothetical protein
LKATPDAQILPFDPGQYKALIGVRAEKLGYAAKFATPKTGKKVLSWCHLALDLLKKSTKYLDLLFDNRAGVLGYHWA